MFADDEISFNYKYNLIPFNVLFPIHSGPSYHAYISIVDMHSYLGKYTTRPDYNRIYICNSNKTNKFVLIEVVKLISILN